MLDFAPEVVGIASQPFWLYWEGEHCGRRHAPDYFVRRADGTATVVDVRADDRIETENTEAFAPTGEACVAVGVAVPAGRHHRPGAGGRCAVALSAPGVAPTWGGSSKGCWRRSRSPYQPIPLWVAAAEGGDRLAVLPTVFYLMRRHELVAD